MRALVFPGFGQGVEMGDVEAREPGEGEVRVSVRAASVNGFDAAVAGGFIEGVMEHRFPVVLGRDYAGTVEAVGPGVEGYSAGDRVMGVVVQPYLADGTIAESVTVPVGQGIARLPESLSFAQGAALGLAGTTALDMLEAAGLRAGGTILVVGATGGVGHLLIQLCLQAGVRVVSTADSQAQLDFVRGLGTTVSIAPGETMNETTRAAYVDGVDAAFHLAGDPAHVLPAVRSGGILVSALLMSPDALTDDRVRVHATYAQPTDEKLAALAEACASGRLRVSIDREIPFDDAPDALAAFIAGKLGKIVVLRD